MPWDHIHSELWLRASVPKTKQPIPSKSTQKQSGQFFFQRGFAGLSTGEATVQGVTLSTSTLNVALITPFPAASKTRNERYSALSQNQGGETETPPPLQLPTPVKVSRLAMYLPGYDDELKTNLIEGFTFGFRLHFQGPYKASSSNNLISAMQHPDVVDTK